MLVCVICLTFVIAFALLSWNFSFVLFDFVTCVLYIVLC